MTTVSLPWTDYIPTTPTERQAIFLSVPQREALYGGSAGSGKSEALLMAALQYVDQPDYAAMLFRRTYADLALAEALMDRAGDWLANTDAVWRSQDRRWEFPSGASLSFGYLDSKNDRYRYQSAAFQFIGFDELTQFREKDYRYLFSRLRRLEGSEVPVRMRAGTNPGGVGHEWVKRRFIDSENSENRIFVPALLDDNPHLDQDEYLENLENLPLVERKQLRDGDWEVRIEGNMFKRGWFQYVDEGDLPGGLVWCRYWDRAATKDGGNYTVGVLGGYQKETDTIYFRHVVRIQETPGGVKSSVGTTASRDGRNTWIVMEQEGGSAGKDTIDLVYKPWLQKRGFQFRGDRPTGSKIERAHGLSEALEHGRVYLVGGPWNDEFVEELVAFPGEGSYDDQVDAAAGCYNWLSPGKKTKKTKKVRLTRRVSI